MRDSAHLGNILLPLTKFHRLPCSTSQMGFSDGQQPVFLLHEPPKPSDIPSKTSSKKWLRLPAPLQCGTACTSRNLVVELIPLYCSTQLQVEVNIIKSTRDGIQVPGDIPRHRSKYTTYVNDFALVGPTTGTNGNVVKK